MSETVKFNSQELIAQHLKLEQMDTYYDLLMDQNQKVNLVSRETKRPDFDRLVAESLLPLRFLPTKMRGYLDIGSGGGFPSIPIMMSGVIDEEGLLVERTGKKARALEQIVSGLGLKARVVSLNFDEIRDTGQVGLVTLRYVKLSQSFLNRIMSRLTTGGKLAYYSTPDFDTSNQSSLSYQFESPQGSVLKSFTIFSR